MAIREPMTEQQRRARNRAYVARSRANRGRADQEDAGFVYGPAWPVPVPAFAPGAYEALQQVFGGRSTKALS